MTPRVIPMSKPGREEGSAPVCPKCGGTLTHNSDPMGYGVTVEQCERFPKCDYWTTLERRVRPELARRPLVDEKKRVRRSPGAMPGADRAPRTARRDVDTVRHDLIVLLPNSRATAETTATLAIRLGYSISYTKHLLESLRDDGRAACAPQHEAGKTGRPANAWWRCA